MIRQLLNLIESRRATLFCLTAHAVGGVFQGIALALLVPLLSGFLTGAGADPRWFAGIVASVLIAVTASITGSIVAFRVASFDLCGTLIRRVGARVQQLPLGWFDEGATGRITTATSTSINTLSHLPSIVLPELMSMGGAAAAVLVASFLHDWRMGLALLLAVPVALIALRSLKKAVVVEHRAEEKAMEALSSRIIEFAQLQPVLRATDSLADGWEPLERALADEHETTDRAGLSKGPAGSLFHAGVEGSLLLALGIGAFGLLGGHSSPTTFIALALMAVRFAEPIGMLAFYVDPLHQARVALDLISSILFSPTLPEPGPDRARSPRPPVSIALTGVDFSYGAGRPVLSGVDLDVPAGSVTALVGPSGSGKSTLLRLVARFWDVDAGSIRVGGADVRDIPEERLMGAMSMVFQDVYLFDTTIIENVRVGRPGAPDDDVALAARRAGLTDVVERMPDGWATRVGEGGSALSGGERQRVALARAFLKDAPILLLDEVTSALDGINEASVTRALAELSEGRTVLVIAHRLSTIRRADRIAVLNGGRIEAVGTHEALYAAGGTYREFWDDQSSVERWRIRRSGS
ncbi:ABC transporter ATP-binding protein/permease [Actinomyces sp. B33]|uniref:ABC transporter ATP-binding protein n=1 Tax=Actinomyces sp. B33 TaxID=2942131 RepID=UPI0023423AB5|nr:ABC transporter ATP-binding protein [Actinomyces sp. B33]MDC4232167.1 ABC transporter ATP-binding protein/permease [Actinomyces sp. B33]